MPEIDFMQKFDYPLAMENNANNTENIVAIGYGAESVPAAETATPEIAIRTEGLTKIYGGVERVSDVSMTVRRGEVYGLIGKNGAGKTTLIRLMLGLAEPTRGKVEIDGADTLAGLKAARTRVGALIEQPAFYGKMNAKENLTAYALAVGAGKTNIPELLDFVGLSGVGAKKVKNFSLGMKQRLSLAMALVGEPDILILDEPVNGLDPTGILHVREQVRYLNEQKGVTIIISSHFLGELGKVATVYGVMKEGRLVKELRGDELRSLARPKIKIVTPDLVRALPVLQSNFAPADYAIGQNGAVEIYRDASALGTVTLMFAEAGVPLLQISAEEGDREAALVALM